jgi:hypothetical protein
MTFEIKTTNKISGRLRSLLHIAFLLVDEANSSGSSHECGNAAAANPTKALRAAMLTSLAEGRQPATGNALVFCNEKHGDRYAGSGESRVYWRRLSVKAQPFECLLCGYSGSAMRNIK